MNEVTRRPDRTGNAAGVPYIAFAPRNPRPSTPLVLVLHLMDPPRSPHAMAAAVPLEGVDAWRVYLGLPMNGERMPEGGSDEIMRLAMEDGLSLLLAPVVEQAAAELPDAVRALREQLAIEDTPLALVGGSAGAAAVLLALAEVDIDVAAAAVINPATRARDVVDAMESIYGFSYEWNDARRSRADRLDFVNRAAEVGRRQTPLLIVVGKEDPIAGLPVSSRELRDTLAEHYDSPDNVAIAEIDGLAHNLADEPGIEPAPQTPGAIEVDAKVTAWLQHYLAGRS